MGLLTRRIQSIADYQVQYDKLKEIGKIVLKPELKDTSKISTVHKWVIELCKESEVDSIRYNERHYFLIVSALLFSPRIFAGKTLLRGVRTAIAKEVNTSNCHISNSIKNVYNWLGIYADFRNSLDYIYEQIQNRIREEGMR